MAMRKPPKKRRKPMKVMGKILPKRRKRNTSIRRPKLDHYWTDPGISGGIGRKNKRQTIPQIRILAGGDMQLYGNMIDCWRNGNTVAGCNDGVNGSSNGGDCCKHRISGHLTQL